MLKEGIGHVAPKPVSVRIAAGHVDHFGQKSRERSEHRGYQRSGDGWKRGFLGSAAEAIFVGMLGEQALCTFLNRRTGLRLSVDTRLLADGDGGIDTDPAGLRIQVKTRVTSKRNLVRRVAKKQLKALVVNVYVFAAWVGEFQRVDLLGWIWSHDLRKLSRFERSRVGAHHNDAIDDKFLEPMSRLVDEIELRRAS